MILAYGATLRPPPDLAGKWELTGLHGTREMNIDQSGRFVLLETSGWKADLKMESDFDGKSSIKLSGSTGSATFQKIGIGESCTLLLEAPIAAISGKYEARRTVWTQPDDYPRQRRFPLTINLHASH